MSKDKERILVIPDTHFVLENPSNRVDLIGEGLGILDDIIKMVNEQEVNRVIFLGDVFDRGYKNLKHKTFDEFYNRIKTLSNILNGEIYLVIGNHEVTFAKDNLMHHWIKLGSKANSILRGISKYTMKEPIFKAVDRLDFGKTLIEFNHFTRKKSTYYDVPDCPGKVKIGLFHDNLSTVKMKYIREADSVQVERLINRYNYVICGHIHVPQPTVKYDNETNCTIIVPGAMISRTTAEVHDYIDIPMIVIDENNETRIESVPYHLKKYAESFDIAQVEANKMKYELKKTMVNNNKILHSAITIDSLLDNFTERDRKYYIIKDASKPIEGEEVNKAEKFLSSLSV